MRQETSEETSETDEGKTRTPLSMIGPPVLLIALAITVGVAPDFGDLIHRAVTDFQDQPAYAQAVLGRPAPAYPSASGSPHGARITGQDLTDGAITAAAALALALLWLYAQRLPRLWDTAAAKAFTTSKPATALRAVWAVQSGIINDYIAWMVLGLACLGGALALAIR